MISQLDFQNNRIILTHCSKSDLFVAEITEGACFIDNGSYDTSCADHLDAISRGDPDCVADIVYRFNVKNVGIVCEPLNNVFITSFGNGFTVELDNLTPSEKQFCPGTIVSILQFASSVDMCALSGTDIDFVLQINDGENDEETVISFPTVGTVIDPEPEP